MEKAMSNTEMTYCEYDFDSFRRYISDTMLRESLTSEMKRFSFEDDANFEKKLRQVKKMVKRYNEGECVKMIYDDTLSGNGKCGMVLTNQRIIDTYLNKYVGLEEVVDIVPMEKYRILVKTANKEIGISCTGNHALRLLFARELKDLLHL